MDLALLNASTIHNELKWFQKLLELRGKITFEKSLDESEFQKLIPPSIDNQKSSYANLIRECNMSLEERIVLILAIIPHVRPSLLDLLHMKNSLYDIPFTEFGGVKYDKQKGYIPTGETALFLIAGDNLERRFQFQHILRKKHFFYKKGILSFEKQSPFEPDPYTQLQLSVEYRSLLIYGESFKPSFNMNFPAKRITTSQVWEDVVLSETLLKGIEEIKRFVSYGKQLITGFDFGRKIKPGFKVLFTGPPGTGKTLTANLLGKSFNMDVYKIDLSLIVSKYIGETEKNLSKVFDQAESRDWILFFDEADALFGKRSSVRTSNDRYANQEVSFLLQRIEDYDGLIILCSNFKKNIDNAFFRRFHLVLDFEIPDAHDRSIIWNKSKTSDFEYASDIDIDHLAERYELSPASIINILHYCILNCLDRNDNEITSNDILAAIKIESIKEGKSIF